MRHVDEGTIHAWLDGQVTDPAERAWIDEHLRDCGTCRLRLADERAAIEGADALLSAIAPTASAGREAFDAAASRAAEAASSPTSSVTRPVVRNPRARMTAAAWAASLALAVAIGWAARDFIGTEPATTGARLTAAQVRDISIGSPASVDLPASSSEAQSPELGPAASARSAAVQDAGRNEPATPAPGNAAGLSSTYVVEPTAPGTAPAVSAPSASAAAVTQPSIPAAQGGGGGGGLGDTTVFVDPPQVFPSGPSLRQVARAGASPDVQGVTPVAGGAGTASGARGNLFGARIAESSVASTTPRAGTTDLTAGRVVVNGLSTFPAPVGAVATSDAWLTVTRTQAAAASGMPLYGINGLTPLATHLSADRTIVQTTYRTESGERIFLTQERIAATERVPAYGSAAVNVAAGPAPQQNDVLQQRARAVAGSEWSTVFGSVRVTLRGTEDLEALGERLRLD